MLRDVARHHFVATRQQALKWLDLRRRAVERELVRLRHDGVAVRLRHVGQRVPKQSSGLAADDLRPVL
jgi:hypothetical protein